MTNPELTVNGGRRPARGEESLAVALALVQPKHLPSENLLPNLGKHKVLTIRSINTFLPKYAFQTHIRIIKSKGSNFLDKIINHLTKIP